MRHSVELTLARLAVRQLTASRRSLWALGLALLPVLLAVLGTPRGAAPDVVLNNYAWQWQMLTVRVLLPIVALVVGTGVFGAEVEDGTLAYVLGKPVARWRMVVARTVVAGLATAAVLVPATAVSGALALRGHAGAAGFVAALSAAVAVGGFLYCALFVALSLSTRRALVSGLGYVIVWEGLLAGTFGGSRALSVRQYTLAFADGLADVKAGVIAAQLGAGTAAAMAVAVAALATYYAVHRLRRYEIGEAV